MRAFLGRVAKFNHYSLRGTKEDLFVRFCVSATVGGTETIVGAVVELFRV